MRSVIFLVYYYVYP